MKELSEGLQLQNELNLIESYDISHHAGKNAVAGCVVYTSQGKTKNSIDLIISASLIGVMILDLWWN